MTASKDHVHVVIADDHPIFRHGLRVLLESNTRIRVVGEATDGLEALELVKKTAPDILLLDLSMPRMPGMEALRALSADEKPVRTVVLTVAIEPTQIVEALQLGARGIVLKDTATSTVLEAIQSVQAGYYWVEGARVTDLVSYLRQLTARLPRRGERNTFGLTPRELEVVAAIVAGCSNREIAQKFSLSEQTVKHHLTSIFNKTGVSSRLELALFAVNHRLVDRL
jgi:DNA-binding NarL/FixJ family response regulator